MKYRSYLVMFTVLVSLAGFGVAPATGQAKMDRIAKEQTMSMLKNVRGAIKKDYYDPAFGGIDIDERFKTAEEKLKAAETLGQAFSIIAGAVMDLNDSHTRFYPPSRPATIEYGWRMKLFGDKTLITAVKEKSDADAKGLKVGDEVLKINGFQPTRRDLWKMIYYYQVLNPQTRLLLDVKGPDGQTRQLAIDAKVTHQKAIINLWDHHDVNQAIREGEKLRQLDLHYFKDFGSVLVWKMPDFAFVPEDVDRFMERAKGKQALILDFRGNPGGYVVTLERFAGYFLDKDTKIADLRGRKPMEPQVAKSKGSNIFTGKVIVLTDSTSASAAEIFARLMQLEKRGIVLGDVSAGAVMQSRGIAFDAGSATVISYGMNLTNADVIMSDGKSLEHVGVTPNEVIVPAAQDVATRRDPVLARALELVGVTADAETVGKIFPQEKFIERTTNVAFGWSW